MKGKWHFTSGVFITLLIVVLSACHKNQPPVITITTPAGGQDVSTLDSILITGTASDDKNLHEFSLVVTNAAGDTAGYTSPYVHGLKNYSFRFYFHPVDTGNYRLTFWAEDHDLGITQAAVDIHASNAPSVLLVSPHNDDDFALTDSILVKGIATNNEGISALAIVGVNYNTGDTAFYQTVPVSGTSYIFSNYFHAVDTGSYYLNVAAFNSKNEPGSKLVTFHMHQ